MFHHHHCLVLLRPHTIPNTNNNNHKMICHNNNNHSSKHSALLSKILPIPKKVLIQNTFNSNYPTPKSTPTSLPATPPQWTTWKPLDLPVFAIMMMNINLSIHPNPLWRPIWKRHCLSWTMQLICSPQKMFLETRCFRRRKRLPRGILPIEIAIAIAAAVVSFVHRAVRYPWKVRVVVCH